MALIVLEGCWIEPIKAHIETYWIVDEAMEVRKLFISALRYALIDGIFYKRSFVILYLCSLMSDAAQLVSEEIHEGICG